MGDRNSVGPTDDRPPVLTYASPAPVPKRRRGPPRPLGPSAFVALVLAVAFFCAATYAGVAADRAMPPLRKFAVGACGAAVITAVTLYTRRVGCAVCVSLVVLWLVAVMVLWN